MSTSALPLASVSPAVAGDTFVLDGYRQVVQEACAYPAPGFCCVTCRIQLANRYQVELHLETARAPGVHVVARYCSTHGAEVPSL